MMLFCTQETGEFNNQEWMDHWDLLILELQHAMSLGIPYSGSMPILEFLLL